MLARITSFDINEVSGLLAKVSNWPLINTSKCEVTQFTKSKQLDDCWRNFNSSIIESKKVITYNNIPSESESSEILLLSSGSEISQEVITRNYVGVESLQPDVATIDEPFTLIESSTSEAGNVLLDDSVDVHYFPGTVVPAVTNHKGNFKILGTIASLPSPTGEYQFTDVISNDVYNYLDRFVSPTGSIGGKFSIFNNPGLIAYKAPIFATKNHLEKYYRSNFFTSLTTMNTRGTSATKGITGLSGPGSP